MKFAKLMMAAALLAGTLFVVTGCGDSSPKQGNPSPSGKNSSAELRSKSLNQLRQIGTACKMYSQDSNEHFPVNLYLVVILSAMEDSKVFVAPQDKKRTPADFSKFPKWDLRGNEIVGISKAYWFSFPDANLSYAYVGTGLTESSNAACPMVFEKPDVVRDGLINVAFVDGSARTIELKNKKPQTCLEIVKDIADPKVIGEKDYAILLKNAEEIDKKAK